MNDETTAAYALLGSCLKPNTLNSLRLTPANRPDRAAAWTRNSPQALLAAYGLSQEIGSDSRLGSAGQPPYTAELEVWTNPSTPAISEARISRSVPTTFVLKQREGSATLAGTLTIAAR